VIRVGEAARQLPNSFKDAHPDMSWRSIKGARNLTSHGNHSDDRMPWQALDRDVPEMGRRWGLELNAGQYRAP